MTHRPKPKFGWYRSEAAMKAERAGDSFTQLIIDELMKATTSFVAEPKWLYGDTRKFSDGTVKVWNGERWLVRSTEI